MSQTKVQLVSNIVGNVSGGASFTGIVTASALNVINDATVGGALTVTNLTVNGTQTIINTTTLDIVDKTVGIASTSTPSNTTADGAGIVVYGGNDGNKSITWDTTSDNWVVVGGGVSATSFVGSGANLTNLNIPASFDWRDSSLF